MTTSSRSFNACDKRQEYFTNTARRPQSQLDQKIMHATTSCGRLCEDCTLKQVASTVSQHEVDPGSSPVPQHDARSTAARCGFWFRCTQLCCVILPMSVSRLHFPLVSLTDWISDTCPFSWILLQRPNPSSERQLGLISLLQTQSMKAWRTQ